MVKTFVTKAVRIWKGYHPLLKILMITALIGAFLVGVAGSIGLLDKFPGW